MSVRLARLLPVTLIGACLATAALAKTTHTQRLRPHLARRRQPPPTAWSIDVASAWQKAGHGHIVLQTFNTASGLDAVRSGAADLAGSARGSSGNPDEAGLTFTPVGWDGLVMITHPSNPVHNLTLAQLHDIYYGKITNWSQVGGKNEPIDLYAVASPGDGVEFSLRKLLFGRGNQPVAAPRLYVNTTKLQEGITLDPKGLGVTTLSNVAGNRKVKMIPINGVAPSASSVANGSYVLFTPLYLVTSSSGAEGRREPGLHRLRQFGQGQGGAAPPRHRAVPGRQRAGRDGCVAPRQDPGRGRRARRAARAPARRSPRRAPRWPRAPPSRRPPSARWRRARRSRSARRSWRREAAEAAARAQPARA